MEAADLRKKSADDLEKELVSLLKDQFAYRMQRSTGQLSQPHLLKEVRREIARVKTVLREKKVNE
jgi:large subunit ribosomal protein L29